jgi:hypothetical protein
MSVMLQQAVGYCNPAIRGMVTIINNTCLTVHVKIIPPSWCLTPEIKLMLVRARYIAFHGVFTIIKQHIGKSTGCIGLGYIDDDVARTETNSFLKVYNIPPADTDFLCEEILVEMKAMIATTRAWFAFGPGASAPTFRTGDNFISGGSGGSIIKLVDRDSEDSNWTNHVYYYHVQFENERYQSKCCECDMKNIHAVQ